MVLPESSVRWVPLEKWEEEDSMRVTAGGTSEGIEGGTSGKRGVESSGGREEGGKEEEGSGQGGEEDVVGGEREDGRGKEREGEGGMGAE
eukprot:2381152-Rhodomonas_salina.2